MGSLVSRKSRWGDPLAHPNGGESASMGDWISLLSRLLIQGTPESAFALPGTQCLGGYWMGE
jgi:hypothetical protein